MSWSTIKDEFTIDDIGARLLANLAKGIYSYEAVLREYVQNACDGYRALGHSEEPETIKITIESDDTIAIQDSGIGMDLLDLKKAKRIAVSEKPELDGMTGFRGIGIWAGFQACDKLELTTTKAGDSHRYQLQIDFKDILEHVEDNINIKTLLDGRFRIQKDDAKKEEHYTRVKLIGIPVASRMLTKKQELERIVSQILPCRVDPKFKFLKELGKFYNSIEDFQEYPIEVEGNEIYKYFPEGINDFGEISLSQDGEDYGKAWWASGNSSLKTDESKFQFRNFRLRVRNFAVGGVGIYDDENASSYGLVKMLTLGSPTHLNWHVGEIHITNPDVRPDTPRSSFELDSSARRAIESIRSFYEDRITDSRALAQFNTYKKELQKSEELLKTDANFDIDEAHKILEKLKEQIDLTKSRPSEKVKKKKRDLVTKVDYKKNLVKQVVLLTEKLSKSKPANTNKEGNSTASAPQAARQTSASSAQKSGSSSSKNSIVSADSVNYEELLSDIFNAVRIKIGDEDELYPEICRAIQTIFEEKGLFYAEQ